MIVALTAAALLMQAAPAGPPAAAKPGTAVSPVTVTPKPSEKVDVAKRTLVCQSEQVLGTMFPKKVCATKEELADRRAFDQAETRKAQALRPYVIDSGKLPGT